MGAHKSKDEMPSFNDLGDLEEEIGVEVKTRGPLPENWKLNITRGKREDELRNEVYTIVRKKCYKKVQQFQQCEKEQGMFWCVFNCAEESYLMKECFKDQYLVEMDRKRRDMQRNPEWWWQNIYDQHGEIGKQAQWKDHELWYHLKFREFKHKLFSN